jgi:hypothetical protein
MPHPPISPRVTRRDNHPDKTLARDNHPGDHRPTATPDSHPDCRPSPIQIVALHAGATASATSGRMATCGRSSAPRRSIGNRDSRPSARTAPRPRGCACASLFGQPRSSAFRSSCVVTWVYPSGLSLLSGIGPIGPSMMGSEERSGTIFRASFVPTERKEQHMHRTHFVHRPARDTSPPQRGTVNFSF